ncbi:MAG: PEGA domain-containing protein [Cellulomonas sp.]|nr:PEGA domain-containing protein [Cellulomonas sp.]
MAARAGRADIATKALTPVPTFAAPTTAKLPRVVKVAPIAPIAPTAPVTPPIVDDPDSTDAQAAERGTDDESDAASTLTGIEEAEWGAGSEPVTRPAESDRQSAVALPARPRAPASAPARVPATAPAHVVARVPVSAPAPDPRGPSGPIRVNPFGVAPGSRSGSAPAHAVPILHGYANPPTASRSQLAYPRYEPPPGEAVRGARSNRRPLVIGLGIVTVALLLFVGLREKREQPAASPVAVAQAAAREASGTFHDASAATTGVPVVVAHPPAPPVDVAAVTPIAEPTAIPADAAASEPVDARVAIAVPAPADATTSAPVLPVAASVELDVTSEPSGANVLLAGAVVGTTPLHLVMPRPAESQDRMTLTVHLARYTDAKATIDLSANVKKTFKLAKVAAPPPVVKDPATKPAKDLTANKLPRPPKQPPDPTKPVEPKQKSCQRPGQVNPFDPRPVCKQ